MSTETILLLILIVFVLGALPAWPHSRSWGYAPGSVLTLLLVVFLVWAIAGGRPLFRSGTIHDAGQDLKSAGRDVADSVRRTVQ
jgi:MFS superfamily sulfate permease-like transporter